VIPNVQQKMMLQIYYLIRRAARWFLRTRKPDVNIEETIQDFAEPIKELKKRIPKLLSGYDKTALDAEVQTLIAQNVPSQLAAKMAICNALFTSLDIVEAARKYQLDIAEVAETYYAMDERLELNWLREQM